METDWKLAWVQIGWAGYKNGRQSTVRNGWAIVNSCNDYAWIEDGHLAVYDPESYYPSGIYEIPLDLIQQLIEKEKQNEQDTPTFMD